MTRNRQSMLPGMEDAPPKSADPSPTTTVAAKEERDPDLSGKSVWVVDALSLIFQVFHAIPEMTSPSGQPVNAVFGFTRDILFLLEEKQPDYLFCAFDLPGPTFRHEMFEDYKKQRVEMPEDLPGQIESIYRVLKGLSAPVLSLSGYEADDVLAKVATVVEELGGDCYLVTGDKDCRQLISDHVKIFNVRKNLLYNAEDLQKDWGVRPDQAVDFQALVGDAVDNVPGVPLIGPKLAKELLGRYGTLEEVLKHADEVSGQKRRQNLIEYREQALLSRRLVQLDRKTPIDIDWSAGKVSGFDMAPALDLFEEFDFRSFADKVRTRLADPKPPQVWKADYQLVATPDALADLVEEMRKQTCIAMDTETTSKWPRWAELVGLSFAWKEGEAYYVPVRAPEGEPCLNEKEALDILRPVLESSEIEKVGQNLKYDIIVLRGAGVHLAGPRFDALVASHLVDAGQRSHGIDRLAKRHLDHDTISIKELIGSGKNQRRMDEVPLDQITPYAAEDADVPLRLRPILQRMLAASDLDELYQSLEIPLIDVLAEMEFTGIKVDRRRLDELSVQFAGSMERLETEIYRLAGREFNIASPKQLQQVLFEELKLPVQKRTSKTGPSTDASVLEQLAHDHDLPAAILQFRQYAKLKGTYTDALQEMIHPQTGRVHTSFNQDGAATGRLSSSDPNLQNIPIRTQSGREIRSAFLPGEKGWKLLSADYSQIELRILAHFSGDATLRAAFENDEDIHARVAGEVYNVSPEEVTSEMRRSAKAVNFGIVYGQSAFGLSKQLNIERSEAEEFIEAYFARYRGVEEFLAKTLEHCAGSGYVSTIMGRRRVIRGIRPGARRQQNLPERTAVNTVIQGSAADLIKLAMIAIHRRLKNQPFSARMLLQIHDELVFEVPAEEVSALAAVVVEEMSGCLPLEVPLKIDVTLGENWAEAEPWVL